MKKGQYIRLFLFNAQDMGFAPIAAAKQMNLHGSAQTEESSTKDTTGDALEYEVTGLSYDISGSGLVLTDNDPMSTGAKSLHQLEVYADGRKLSWKICVVDGTNNRTIDTVICSGEARLTQLQMQGQNRQNATFSYTLTGVGKLYVGTQPSSSNL